MRSIRLSAIIILLYGLGIVACTPDERSLTILDSVSQAPVPGALVYSAGERAVFRSDVHGFVALPAGFGSDGLRVFAKNYQLRELGAAEASGVVLLEFDESLVNPVERRLVFDRADTLRGTYGPFRENNDLLTYDLNLKVDVE